MSLIVCPECGGKVSDKASVCIHCGYPLHDKSNERQYCPYCGKENWFTDVFCDYCGKKIKVSNEEKEVVVKNNENNIVDIMEYGNLRNRALEVQRKELLEMQRENLEIQKKQLIEQELRYASMAKCPRCGSTSISGNKKGFSASKAFAGAMLMGEIGVLAGSIGSNKVVVNCLNCGYKFNL